MSSRPKLTQREWARLREQGARQLLVQRAFATPRPRQPRKVPMKFIAALLVAGMALFSVGWMLGIERVMPRVYQD